MRDETKTEREIRQAEGELVEGKCKSIHELMRERQQERARQERDDRGRHEREGRNER